MHLDNAATAHVDSPLAVRLRLHGVSPTQQRMDIAQIVLAKYQHVSAEQVLEMVNANGPVVSKATVYNTLGLFARNGLIRELVIDPTKVFYDSNTTEHHHIYNVDTGELLDIESIFIDPAQLPEAPAGTVRAGLDLIMRVRQAGV